VSDVSTTWAEVAVEFRMQKPSLLSDLANPVFFLLFCKIAQLKIDANPFAKAFRRDGLHGKAKR